MSAADVPGGPSWPAIAGRPAGRAFASQCVASPTGRRQGLWSSMEWRTRKSFPDGVLTEISQKCSHRHLDNAITRFARSFRGEGNFSSERQRWPHGFQRTSLRPAVTRVAHISLETTKKVIACSSCASGIVFVPSDGGRFAASKESDETLYCNYETDRTRQRSSGAPLY